VPTPTLFPWRGGGKYRYIVKTLGLKRENRYYNCSISLKLKNHIEKELYKGRLKGGAGKEVQKGGDMGVPMADSC